MICKLTKKEGAPIKAHIIPKCFFKIDSNQKGVTRLLSNSSNSFPKKAPNGIYDQSIVIDEGEKIFSKWDDYASTIFLNESEKYEWKKRSDLI